MKKSEIATLLVFATVIDERVIVTEATVEAWHSLMGGITLEDATAGMQNWYRTNVDNRRLMPASIIAYVKELWQERLTRYGDLAPNCNPNDIPNYLAELRQMRDDVKHGRLVRNPRRGELQV